MDAVKLCVRAASCHQIVVRADRTQVEHRVEGADLVGRQLAGDDVVVLGAVLRADREGDSVVGCGARPESERECWF